jgi:hypothetical protein
MTTETTETTETAEAEPVRELASAYAKGDFARLRKRARELGADSSVAESTRKRAHEWAQRVSVDVVVYALLAFAFTLFCAIVLRYALP